MRHQAATTGQAARQEPSRCTARRVLQQLFELDLPTIDDSRTLADFESCKLPNMVEPLSPMAWRIWIKERVYACFGVDCDVDEPLSSLVARIELAERGVGCTLAH